MNLDSSAEFLPLFKQKKSNKFSDFCISKQIIIEPYKIEEVLENYDL
jgi:hypothetical protein